MGVSLRCILHDRSNYTKQSRRHVWAEDFSTRRVFSHGKVLAFPVNSKGEISFASELPLDGILYWFVCNECLVLVLRSSYGPGKLNHLGNLFSCSEY